MAVFDTAGQVSVTRTRNRDWLRRLAVRLYRHHLLPMLPIFILDENADRRPSGKPIANAGNDARAVVLDLLPATAAIALLPLPKNRIDIARGERRSVV